MRVHIYDVDQNTAEETDRGIADLAECFPDLAERCAAERELRANGRYWCGGGAASLVLLTRVVEDETCAEDWDAISHARMQLWARC